MAASRRARSGKGKWITIGNQRPGASDRDFDARVQAAIETSLAQATAEVERKQARDLAKQKAAEARQEALDQQREAGHRKQLARKDRKALREKKKREAQAREEARKAGYER